MSGSPYVLGHSEHELERLTQQAALIGPVTRALLVEAGVGPGMRVLDVGTGRGDVALIAAELVGEEGSVVGVDLAPSAVAAARERVARLHLRNVSFREGDPATVHYEQRFDAVVGRYVLQFIPDPSATLRRLAANIVPGGVVAFHEIDWTGIARFPSLSSGIAVAASRPRRSPRVAPTRRSVRSSRRSSRPPGSTRRRCACQPSSAAARAATTQSRGSSASSRRSGRCWRSAGSWRPASSIRRPLSNGCAPRSQRATASSTPRQT